ncbi:MAG: PIN domain-containing protein [Selenomonadaceae bacterium]|nr:PIN domain-containing protein [Selenomonadaceae bacterium]
MVKVMLDTNMILRYLLNDNPIMYEKSKQLLKMDSVWVTLEVIAEVVYVLRKVYAMERPILSDKIREFVGLVECGESDVLKLAIDTYAEKNLDFVDCVLYAYNKKDGFKIATFDKKLLQLLNCGMMSDDEQT